MQDNKIKSYISLRGYTIERLAREMGISSASLSAKINGKRDFTVPQAQALVNVLNIPDPASIFFT